METFETNNGSGRRTTADEVFEQLRSDIVSLRLAPGTKVSEMEIAKKAEVSRQPVREAFIRLNNMRLLKIQPQKATQVRKISPKEILNSRFIRTAVECEVLRNACLVAANDDFLRIEENLERQKAAAEAGDSDAFHLLDYEFHYYICVAGRSEFAYSTIAQNKSQVDRLCMLSLTNQENMRELIEDHTNILTAIKNRDPDEAVELTRKHLSRLDQTLENAKSAHSEYFEE